MCGARNRFLMVVAAAACLAGGVHPAAAVVASLPGDADCDGLVTSADLGQLGRELTDGDGVGVVDADGGAVVSCSGVDANGDGAVTAADFTAIGRLLSGGETSAGPIITYIGIASADGTVTAPASDMPVPVYQSIGGLGFRLVIEAMPGPANIPVGQQMVRTHDDDPPDLQVQVTRDLGDGNTTVCGEGGVPGLAPPSFAPRPGLNEALNDIGCRFEFAANPFRACTFDAFGVQRFVDPRTRAQFCLSVSSVEAFPAGATIITARVLDTAGTASAPAQIVLRVGNEPLVTVTPRPTATATIALTPTATATSTETPVPSDTESPLPTASLTTTATPRATATSELTASASPTRSGTPTRTLTPSPTGSASATGTRTRTHTPGPSPTPTDTSVASPTATRTGTRTATATPTRTGSSTPSATRTAFPSVTETGTRTQSATATRTPSITPTRTLTVTGTVPATGTSTATRTPSPTRTPTATGISTATHTATATPRPPTPTVTRAATGTATRTAAGTRTATATTTASGTRTATFTRTGTPTQTITGTIPPSSTATLTRTATRTPTATGTRTTTGTPAATATRTPTATGTITRTGTVTRTGTATGTTTPTRTDTVTRTPSRTGTATRTATITLSPTITRTPTQTWTPTPTGRPGADITYVGLVRANDEVVPPSGTTAEGWPIYERPFGFSFSLLVEAKPGPSRRPVGLNAFRSDLFDPSVRPDLEVIVSRALGNGSLDVCDDMLPFIGGIPASLGFEETQSISNAINDLACRFVNGDGLPGGRRKVEACTVFGNGEFDFVNAATTVQFCALIAEPFEFPIGDTVVSARVRDSSGQAGPAASFVVRIAP